MLRSSSQSRTKERIDGRVRRLRILWTVGWVEDKRCVEGRNEVVGTESGILLRERYKMG